MIITGIESGNDFIRKEVANRNVSSRKIFEALGRVQDAGIELAINNMIGFPGETFDQFMDTLNMNAVIGPKRANASIFYPYPGTQLYKTCIEKNLISEHKTGDLKERAQTILEFADFPKKQIERISFVFFPLVIYQRMVYKLFGLDSIFSIKYTEPIISRIMAPLLHSFYGYKKLKSIISSAKMNNRKKRFSSINPISIYRRYKKTISRSSYY
jgi:radical SAM superfamily enzyme YgiQ (UPF0313 family)